MRFNLNTTSKYLEEVDTLDELEVDSLKRKTWNKIMAQNVYKQLSFRHKSFKNPSRGVPRGLSRIMIDYNNSLVTGKNLFRKCTILTNI